MKIHFVGIGGIGVSALAGYYLVKGHEVSGSDIQPSKITENLQEMGASIYFSHNLKKLSPETDILIHTPAVSLENAELKKAKNLGIKIQSYPEALGELSKKYFTIAISGTHGKSTTTAMTSLILIEAGLDPTVIIGTKLKEFGNKNFRVGKSKYLIIEADEWKASFLNYYPQVLVINNIEAEHLDYYKDLNHILKTFIKYTENVEKGGCLILNKDDKNILKLKENISFKNIKEYSLSSTDAMSLKKILKIPGRHNLYNALATLSISRVLNIPDSISFRALSLYKGSWRRFEESKGIISNKKVVIVSDYGHHPSEVRETLVAAREKFKNKRIWCIFQPHQKQRTFFLFNDFVKVFKSAPIDKIIITDIYDVAGRENKEIEVSSKDLSEKSGALYISKEEIGDYVKKNVLEGDVIIIMGAGDIYKLEESLQKNN